MVLSMYELAWATVKYQAKRIKRLVVGALIAIVMSGYGCKSGQMGTILGPSIGGGAALLTAGYQYAKHGEVDLNDTVTAGNLGWNAGSTAGYATDNYQLRQEIKKLKRRR